MNVKLGEQVVLKSKKAFDCIEFAGWEAALSEEYYTRKIQRDVEARHKYADYKSEVDYMNDIFIVDIIRGRVKNEDLCIR